MAHAFSSTRDAMAVVNAQWNVLEINEAMGRLAGDDSGIMPGAERLRAFRSCPLIAPKRTRSSLQMLAIARAMAVLCA